MTGRPSALAAALLKISGGMRADPAARPAHRARRDERLLHLPCRAPSARSSTSSRRTRRWRSGSRGSRRWSRACRARSGWRCRRRSSRARRWRLRVGARRWRSGSRAGLPAEAPLPASSRSGGVPRPGSRAREPSHERPSRTGPRPPGQTAVTAPSRTRPHAAAEVRLPATADVAARVRRASASGSACERPVSESGRARAVSGRGTPPDRLEVDLGASNGGPRAPRPTTTDLGASNGGPRAPGPTTTTTTTTPHVVR